MPLTPNQLSYQQYLRSPHWQRKRAEAFAHYGPTCHRCPQPGEEVHHKTYEHLGDEPMEDLEILCGPCHGAHHRVEKIAKGPRKKGLKTLHRKGILSYLTGAMRRDLMAVFNLTFQQLAFEIIAGDNEAILKKACEQLGLHDYYPKRLKGKRGKKHPNHRRKPHITY